MNALRQGQASLSATAAASLAAASPTAGEALFRRPREGAGAAALRLARGPGSAPAGLELVRAFDDAGAGAGAVLYTGGVDKTGAEVVVRAAAAAGGGLAVDAAASRAGLSAASFSVSAAGGQGFAGEARGPLVAAFAGPYPKKDGGGLAVRVLVVAAGGAAALAQQEKLAWVREEAIAALTEVSSRGGGGW